MDRLAILHIVLVAFWLGVVAVEIIFERARIGREARVLMHKLTDRFVELPVITLVLITGLMLWSRASWSMEYLPKVLFGVLAIGANAICYCFVEKRTVESGAYQEQSRNILWITVPGLAGFLIAAYLGGRHAAFW